MCHVLIIEDDWIIADHIAQLVESAGATSVSLAETEDAAVIHALLRTPGLIISDVHLKSGTGPAAIERIFASLGNLPVMFVTGEPRSFRPYQQDMSILHKPVEDRILVEAFPAIAPLA